MTKPMPLGILLILIGALPFLLNATASPWWVYYPVGILVGFLTSTRLSADRLQKFKACLKYYVITVSALSGILLYFLAVKEPIGVMLAGFFAHYAAAAPSLTDRTILGRTLLSEEKGK